MTYYAHVSDDGQRMQTVAEHLTGTAELCRGFAAAFGAAEAGELAGLAHDLGKCTEGFQNRLLRGGPIVDHATAGALVCARINADIAACVAGHHGGLPDFGNVKTDRAGDATLCSRLRKGIEQKTAERCGESGVSLPGAVPPTPVKDALQESNWTRMLYSCLVDADYLDTERFMRGEQPRGGGEDIETLLARLGAYIARWKDPKSELNRLRNRILERCLDSGALPQGIYTLTVPTGGGKTVASLAFALRHAAAHGLRRVIYVVPYTSIIEQNAGKFREILGERNVLEHHSGVELDLSDGAKPECVRLALAAENWDVPVVVTTAVQFFESFYANKPAKCRKLHNLAQSVVIFDEAQMLPPEHLRPCVAAIASLAAQFGSTAVLCTATQPALDGLLREYAPGCPVRELCPDAEGMEEQFRRVTFRFAGTLPDEALAERLGALPQVLCIVNSRKAAQRIFSLLPEEDGTFHLSTLMVPAQRHEIIETIRKRLEGNAPCRVVSTSLIEAGVDVDFPAVFREMAGFDSVMQAAGRCNREGGKPAAEGIVTVFERTELPPKLFRTAIGAAREALKADPDPASRAAMDSYFHTLLSLRGEALDRSGVIDAFRRGIGGCALPFRSVAERFRLIDDNTRTVYIPRGEGAALTEQLLAGEGGRELYRALGRYVVSVYEEHFRALYAAGALLTAREVPTLDENSAVLTSIDFYNEKTGLTLEPEGGQGKFI